MGITLKNKKYKKYKKYKTKRKKHHKKISNNNNVNLLDIKHNDNTIQIHLNIKDELYLKNYKGNRYQYWFNFHIKHLVKDKEYTFFIHKLKNFYNDWKKVNICASYDNKHWFRINTKFNKYKKYISWDIKNNNNNNNKHIYFAFYVPYDFNRVKKIINKHKQFMNKVSIIGHSHKKLPIYMLKYGNGNKNIWLIARQHPGESISSWIMEGILNNIHKYKSLLNKYTICIFPCANPDGVNNGNWYTNYNGINLNKDWLNKKSIEVRHIYKIINKHKTDNDIYIDIHGDEGANKHFITYGYNDKPSKTLYNKFNKLINQYDNMFKRNDTYLNNKISNHTFDNNFSPAITIEGGMQHSLNNKKTIQYVPINIGNNILKVLNEL